MSFLEEKPGGEFHKKIHSNMSKNESSFDMLE